MKLKITGLHRILITACLLMAVVSSPLPTSAQSGNLADESVSQQDPLEDVMVIDIPMNLEIRDRVYVVNNSYSTILQLALAHLSRSGITSSKNVSAASIATKGGAFAPGEKILLWKPGHERVKTLVGQTIGLKVKGVLPGVNPDSKNLKPEDITYDFDIEIKEHRHDLYIYLSDKSVRSGLFDF